MSNISVRIQRPVRHQEPAFDHIRVPFEIDYADGAASMTVGGMTVVSHAGDRVWVETVIEVDAAERNVLCHKLDPNERENDFDVVVAEVEQIEPFTLPVTTNDLDLVAAVVHAYVINGRPEWW